MIIVIVAIIIIIIITIIITIVLDIAIMIIALKLLSSLSISLFFCLFYFVLFCCLNPTSVLKFICSYRFVNSFKIVRVSSSVSRIVVDDILCRLCLKSVKNVYLQLLRTVFKSYIVLKLYAHNFFPCLKNSTTEMLNYSPKNQVYYNQYCKYLIDRL